MEISKNGASIRTVEDWFRIAPPKGGQAQWAMGRSAYESAAAWCGAATPAPPAEIAALITGHPDFGAFRVLQAEPECQVRFDKRRGEPRNADLVATAEDHHGTFAISVEAKADEPFDRRVADVLADAVDRTSHGERSNAVQRVEDLAAALLPARAGRAPGLGEIRYQLLTAAAGALAYGAANGASRCVLVIHEFVTARTEESMHARNAADLEIFVRRLSGGLAGPVMPGRLLGPFRVPGEPLFAGDTALYIGKAVRNTRAAV